MRKSRETHWKHADPDICQPFPRQAAIVSCARDHNKSYARKEFSERLTLADTQPGIRFKRSYSGDRSLPSSDFFAGQDPQEAFGHRRARL